MFISECVSDSLVELRNKTKCIELIEMIQIIKLSLMLTVISFNATRSVVSCFSLDINSSIFITVFEALLTE